MKPVEGEFVLLKGGPTDEDWYCAQILEVLTDRIKLSWYTTPAAPLHNYKGATRKARYTGLRTVRFSKTWTTRHNGLPTIIGPVGKDRNKILWTGRIPLGELDQHLLVRNVTLQSNGKLAPETLTLAAGLPWPHHKGA